MSIFYFEASASALFSWITKTLIFSELIVAFVGREHMGFSTLLLTRLNY